jgi:hypothetical protein
MKTICMMLFLITAHAGPDDVPPSPPPEASQFDFLLGAWDIDVTLNHPDLPPKARGRWTAQKSADGFMVTDEYRILDDQGRTVYLGETYRVFNPANKQWEFRYVEPQFGTWHEGTGKWEGNEMHLTQTNRRPNGGESILKIRYYDITPQHFRWAGERSEDGGKTWKPGPRIEATRAK